MRFLFSALTSHGSLGPAVSIAEQLRQRGHEVAFVTGPAMAPWLEKVGMRRIPRGPQDGPSFTVEHSANPLDQARQVKHFEHAMKEFPPDVLVGHAMAFGAVLTGARHQIPTAVIGLAANILPTEAYQRKLPAELRAYQVVRLHGLQTYEEFIPERYGRLMESYNICTEIFWLPKREVPPEQTPLLGDLHLLQSVPELEGEVELLQPQTHLVGSCAWDFPSADPQLERWLAKARESGEPILYTQPGRVFNSPGFWRPMCEALGNRPVRVVASTGRMDGELGEVPPNFYVRSHVPQALVLPHAHGVISSATTTGVLGALTRGLPLLLVPGGGGGEQSDLTLRCLLAGVALHLHPTEVSAANFGQKVEELLSSDSLRRNARRLQERFTQAPGSAGAATLLERLGQERRPILRESTVPAVLSVA
ncbi:MAG: glycosyltransferase [Hyalangium sp.]|uniref:glycosyltransferase n=1 Tax=Hyalangium sp. TaxID=2028555 RepID=UPI00389ADF73